MTPAKIPDNLNLPNFLSLFRIVASFVFLVTALHDFWNVAFLIFCLAALTDMIDGTIARILGQRTPLGAFLDPMADKLLMFFGFMALTFKHVLPWPLTALVVVRDVFIVGGLAILKSQHARILYRPTYLSKMTTLFQILTLVLALLLQSTYLKKDLWMDSWMDSMIHGLPIIVKVTAFLTLATGIQYYRIGREMLRHAKLNSLS